MARAEESFSYTNNRKLNNFTNPRTILFLQIYGTLIVIKKKENISIDKPFDKIGNFLQNFSD